MKLIGITKKRLDELNIKITETERYTLNNEHSRNNTTIADETIFHKNFGEMRDTVFGALYKFKIATSELMCYILFVNGKRIDFIDDAYALEKFVEFSDNVVIVKVYNNAEITPWLVELDYV